MPAATVIANPVSFSASGAANDAKLFGNMMALSGNGSVLGIQVYKATVDPANLIDAAGETIQLTACTGVVLGRSAVIGIFPGVDLQDITVTGYVQANNVIELRVQNEGAATVNLASSTWYVAVMTLAAGL